MNFGEIIKQKRLAMGLSMGDVANKAKITRRTMINIENGESSTVKVLSAVCDVLDMELIIKNKEI